MSYDKSCIHDPYAPLQSVEDVSYRLGDIESGSIKIFRILESSPDGVRASKISPEKARVLESSVSKEDVNDPCAGENGTNAPLSVLPPSPTSAKRCPREKIVDEILYLTDQLASVTLFGLIGVGKSFVARTVLDHSRTKATFGENRYFIRCDDLANSLDALLERLSDAVLTGPTVNETQLRSHLESSPPILLFLDDVDSILDQLTPESEEISATIEEFGRYDNVCLVTVSRMNAEIHGFHRIEVPTPSEEDARDIFYGLCDLERSSGVDSFISRLDPHPLCIEHFGRYIREKNFGERMLLERWSDDQTRALEASYFQKLKDTIEPVLHFPMIKSLGTIGRDVLEAVAAFPSGLREYTLERIVHSAGGTGEIVEALCKFSLIYRQDGVVKMVSPFQIYFLESMIRPAQTEEVINVRWGPDCMPAKACISFSLHPFCGCDVTFFEGLPIYTAGPPIYTSGPPTYTSGPPTFIAGPPSRTPSPGAPRRRRWIGKLPTFVKKSKRNYADFLCIVTDYMSCPYRTPAAFRAEDNAPVISELQVDLANMASAVRDWQIDCALVAYDVD